MSLSDATTLLRELERSPESVQLHHGELDSLIASCMNTIHELSLSGEDNERELKLVGIECLGRFPSGA